MHGFVVGVLMVLLAAQGAGAASINLITNPNFDDADGISGWTGSSAEWDMNLDVDADPNSGSIRIVNEAAGMFIARTAFSNCAPVAEVDYELRSWVYIPSGQANTSIGAHAGLNFYASPNCIDLLTRVSPEVPRVALLDQWQLFKGTVRTPTGAQSAQMFVDIAKNESGGSLVGNHDAISWRVAPLSSEDSRFGAGTITRDNATGLGWLDVTLSTSFTYNEILLELVPGGAFEGFRLATSDEMLEFWVNSGINIDAGFLNQFATENFLPVVDLMALVGVTGEGNLGGGNFFDFSSGYIESVPDSRGFITASILSADPDPTLTARRSFGFSPPDNVNASHGSLLVLVLEPEAEGNVALNSYFDTNVDDWTAYSDAVLDWSSIDIDNSPSSGSARIRDDFDVKVGKGIRQCMPVAEAASYDFSASAFIPSGQSGFSNLQLRLHVVEGTDCSGTQLDFHSVTFTTADMGDWATREILDIVTPAGTQSVFVIAMLFKNNATDDIDVFIDNITMVPEPLSSTLSAVALLTLALLARASRQETARNGVRMPRSRHGCHMDLEFKWSTQQTRLVCLQGNKSSTSSEAAG